MPWESKKQARYMHANPSKLGQAKLKEFDDATAAQPGGYASLPERAPKKRTPNAKKRKR